MPSNKERKGVGGGGGDGEHCGRDVIHCGGCKITSV